MTGSREDSPQGNIDTRRVVDNLVLSGDFPCYSSFFLYLFGMADLCITQDHAGSLRLVGVVNKMRLEL